MATYVLSDIHGLYDKFIGILNLINFNDNDELYILGDVIDRGPGGLDILDFIRNKSNIHLLLGNHEQMLIEFFTVEYNDELDVSTHPWLYNGGLITFNQLEDRGPDYLYKLLSFLSKLPKYKVIDNYVLVHAGLSSLPNLSSLDDFLSNSTDDDLLWSREFIYKDIKVDNYTVICGHTPTQKFGSDSIIKFKNNILVDCGCASNIALGCLRLDDMKEFYI